MRRSGSRLVLLSLLAAAAVTAACADDPAAPGEGLDGPAIRSDLGKGGGDSVTTGGTGGNPQGPQFVDRFTATVVVLGRAPSGPDTSATERVPGARIVVYRVATAQGDTLVPSPEVASATTDASGTASFADLPSAFYRFAVAPPAGSAFAEAAAAIGRPTQADVRVHVALPRK